MLFAAIPFLAVLFLLLVKKRGTAETSLYGLGITLLIAVFVFGLSWKQSLVSLSHGLSPAFRVVYVVVMGLWFYQLLRRTGVFDKFPDLIDRLSENPLRRTLFVVAVMGPFFEAVSGFGAGIVLTGPLVLALGYRGMQAAVLALLTQNAVPWGAMAVGTVLGSEIANVPLQTVGVLCTIFSLPLLLFWIFTAALTAVGWRLALRQLPDVFLTAGLLGGSLYVSNRYLQVPTAGVTAGLITGFLLAIVWRRKQQKSDSGKQPLRDTWQTLLPYLVFLLFLLSDQLLHRIPEAAKWLSGSILDSPGTVMLITCLILLRLYKISIGEVSNSVRDTWRQSRPTVISTICFVALGMVMKDAGMIGSIAGWLANYGFPIPRCISGCDCGICRQRSEIDEENRSVCADRDRNCSRNFCGFPYLK
ncbi:L-lactate permease [Effusibacillus dendaii]|uniref:L-lactate permease n=1 Tax=Effusibacillus dendaii TaxID=2743772 RepID=UPI001CF7C44E|nr:L-lactate permease [Effusibacillus dendaii]